MKKDPEFYGGWKNGANWYHMANTLKKAHDLSREAYLAAYHNLDVGKSVRLVPGGGVEIKVDFTELDIDDIDQYRVSMLLMGYCLENIFKGIIVVGTWLDCPRCLDVDDFNKLYVPMNGCGPCMRIDTHELRNLLQTRAMKNITFSPEEKKMMDTLVKYIKWAGRYPMPKTQDEINNTRWGPVEPIMSPYSILDAIYDKSMNELIRVCTLQGEK